MLRISINVRVRSQPHRTSSSTKCSSRARRSGAASGWVASVAQGARGCGWSKHESGPALHALQLCSIEYVPPKPTSRERELPTVSRVPSPCADASQRDVRQTAAVSRCVSELHGKSIGSSRSMYLLPGNPFSHAVEAYRDSGRARCPNYLQQAPTPFIYSCNLYAYIYI